MPLLRPRKCDTQNAFHTFARARTECDDEEIKKHIVSRSVPKWMSVCHSFLHSICRIFIARACVEVLLASLCTPVRPLSSTRNWYPLSTHANCRMRRVKETWKIIVNYSSNTHCNSQATTNSRHADRYYSRYFIKNVIPAEHIATQHDLYIKGPVINSNKFRWWKQQLINAYARPIVEMT